MLSNATRIVVWIDPEDEAKAKSYGIIHVYGHNEAELERVVSHCNKRCDNVEVGVSEDRVLAVRQGARNG